MRKFILILTVLLGVVPAKSQTRVLVGGTGGDLYNNIYGGAVGRLEVPVSKHLELDLGGELSPRTELKSGLGSGWGYTYGTNAVIWFNKIGIDAGINASEYSVTKTSKNEYFVQGGLVYRRLWFDMPTRFTFDYVREIKNGLLPNGDETNRLQGGSVTFDTRFTCKGPFCLRLLTNIQTGVVTNQGNPRCDGAYGPVTCPRSKTLSGGASMSLLFEFPRRKQTETEVF